MESLVERARSIASNRDAGASALLALLLPLLADAILEGEPTTLAVARIVCRGQPAMAPLWNAAAAAVADSAEAGRFARVRAEMERAPAALARAAGAALLDALQGLATPQIVTLSNSGGVAAAVEVAARERAIRVVCGEGRPRFEGRTMATRLAQCGVRVLLATDAALTAYLTADSVVVVGGDAVSERHWINKVGTRALASAALPVGIPVYVVASRDKAQSKALTDAWRPTGGSPEEVWVGAPSSVRVENPYFERIPVELATLFLMDAGVVPPADLAAVSERYAADISQLISKLG